MFILSMLGFKKEEDENEWYICYIVYRVSVLYIVISIDLLFNREIIWFFIRRLNIFIRVKIGYIMVF